MAWMSLLGMYNYSPDIFAGLRLPEQLDKGDVIRNILLDTAELEVIYPDPEIMRQAISAWSDARLNSWNRMATVLYAEYDPFVNIKRDEVRTIKSSGASNSTGSSLDQVSAWNASDFANRGQQTDAGSTNTSHDVTETLHVEGDSAITDAQDVLRKELKVRLDYDMYQIIINEFKQRFCLMVY